MNGYIHCDPHPGNILVRKNENGEAEIIMLDHGLYQVCLLNKFPYAKRFAAIEHLRRRYLRCISGLLGSCEQRFE